MAQSLPATTDGEDSYSATRIHFDLADRQIRLLTLLPGNVKDPLQFTMSPVSLDNALRSFEALSWTWGAPSTNMPVVSLNEIPFPVQSNLYNGLLALRLRDRSRTLWIDAICINQKDNAEKSSQIPLMVDIYSLAKRVVVWLGNLEDDSDFVISCISSGEKFRTERCLTGLIKLLNRPWFSRTWILQEFVVNDVDPIILCGLKSIEWSIFERGCWDIIGKDGSMSNNLPPLERKRYQDRLLDSALASKVGKRLNTFSYLRQKAKQSGFKDVTLSNALLWSEGSLATDPRDKIYGLLGLVGHRTRAQFLSEVAVDYESPIESVFRQTTIFILCTENSPSMYVEHTLLRKIDYSQPSWIVNFNLRVPSRTRINDMSTWVPAPMNEIRVTSDNKRLIIQGVIVDGIKRVCTAKKLSRTDSSTEGQDLRQWLNPMRKIEMSLVKFGMTVRTMISKTYDYDHAKLAGEYAEMTVHLFQFLHGVDLIMGKQYKGYETSNQLSEPFWKTLRSGTVPKGQLDALSSHFERQYIDMLTLVRGNLYHRTVMEYLGSKADSDTLYAALMNDLTERSFFMSQNGWYGISEKGTKEGDCLAFLFPQRFMPCIIRPKGNVFEFISAAYVPPQMKEAAIPSQSVPVREIIIG